MGERKLCYGCMERTEFSRGVCPNCGYYDQSPSDPSFIIPGTTLNNNRYIVGVALSANGEGITYLAYDQSISCKVLLREYMPRNLCNRVTGSPVISVIPARLAQYKALMAEFTELHKSLAHLRGQVRISTVVDLFAENNTTYVVNEYVDSIRFVDYLKENAGELTWGQLSHMLPPLLTTLSLLHNTGVIHRAISPETIYVTRKGELLLTAFSSAAVRTANTELECEIYNGYAAPEQYSVNSRQGTWTDVYAICAVIYRVLTGSMPPSAISRMENDNLVAPNLLNPNVPRHVSNVIMQGLSLNGNERIQTVTELVTRLFDEHAAEAGAAYAGYAPQGGYGQPQQNPPYGQPQPQQYRPQQQMPPQEQPYDNGYAEPEDYGYNEGYTDDYAYDDYGGEEQYEDDAPQKAGAVDRLKVPIIVGIVLLLAFLICLFVFGGNLFGGEESSSGAKVTATTVSVVSGETTTEATAAATGDSVMPDLLGKNYDAQKERYASWITFDVEEVYSDVYAKGQICWQEFESGDTFDSSKPVKIQVSKGSATVQIPSYSGYGLQSYSAQLDELNIPYTTAAEINEGYTNGSVTRIVVTKGGKEVDISAGASINLNDNYQITVYYANNPVVTTEEPTEEPTEATTAAAAETTVPAEQPTEAPATEAPQQ